MTLTEASTVEHLIRNLLRNGITYDTYTDPGFTCKNKKLPGLGWQFFAPSNIHRQTHELLVEESILESRIRLYVSAPCAQGRHA